MKIFLEHENRICKSIHCVTSRSHLTFKGKWENAWINIRNELVRGGDLWNYSYTPIQFYFISSVASVLCHYLLSIVFLLFQIIKLSLKSWSKWLQQWKSNLGVSFTLKAGSIEYNNSHMIFNEEVQKFRWELSYYWVCMYNFSSGFIFRLSTFYIQVVLCTYSFYSSTCQNSFLIIRLCWHHSTYGQIIL